MEAHMQVGSPGLEQGGKAHCCREGDVSPLLTHRAVCLPHVGHLQQAKQLVHVRACGGMAAAIVIAAAVAAIIAIGTNDRDTHERRVPIGDRVGHQRKRRRVTQDNCGRECDLLDALGAAGRARDRGEA